MARGAQEIKESIDVQDVTAVNLLRHMELPRFLRTIEGTGQLAATIDAVCAKLKFGQVHVLSGSSVSKDLAVTVVGKLDSVSTTGHMTVTDNTWGSVGLVVDEVGRAQPDAVLAVGGGRVIDVSKAACIKLGLPVIVVPTLLSADGIASPVSVLADDKGRIDSHPAKLPIAVLVDLDVIARGPVSAARAGFGDLLANRSAVDDWRLAARGGNEDVDDFAALLSESAAELAWSLDVTSLGEGSPTKELLRRLLHGLVLSGLAMEIAGSSRPCSGAEHLISHALDRLYPGTASHGEQVAFGAVVATHLRDGDWTSLQDLLHTAGMDAAAQGFGLDAEKVVAAIQAAPDTRPDRYTVLSDLELDERQLLSVVEEISSKGSGRAIMHDCTT